ncbi:MAG: flavin reductase family protein [Bacilli bacterium]|nr:flavin reductase family protein [Bacilli bacterium]
MRIKLKPAANVVPLPVLMIATYNEDGTCNVMNAAWGTQYSEDVISVYLSKHKTTENMFRTKAFTVSFATRKTVEESDYFGIVSGHKANKVGKVNFHPIRSEVVDAPLLEEYPLTLECEIDHLDEDGPDAYILFGKVKGVSVDESVLTDGKVDIEKLEPIAFCPYDHTYRVVGEVAGKAFNCGLKFR